MKYESQAAEISNLLSSAQNILIALPSQPSVDDLAAGLALLLSLEQTGKKASIATEGTIKVGHTNLFGVGEIKSQLPTASGGNFTITLGGVVSHDASGASAVPALEKISWDPIGSDLKLVFHVTPGQKFEPTQVAPGYEGGNFDLIITIGAINLEALGSLYTVNQQVFTNASIINIDNKSANTSFGKANLIDNTASSVSEIIAQALPSLHLPAEGDIATNLLNGIFESTGNLQGDNVSAETFETMALLVRSGGQKPGAHLAAQAQAASGLNIQQPPVQATPQPQPVSPNISSPTPVQTNSAPAPVFDNAAFQQIFNINPPQQAATPEPPVAENFTVPPVVNEAQPEEDQSSPEETPGGEGAGSGTPEADWLTPKIYKGSSLG